MRTSELFKTFCLAMGWVCFIVIMIAWMLLGGCITAEQKATIESAWEKIPTATATPIPTPTPKPTPVPPPTPIPEPINSPDSGLGLNNRVVREMAEEYDIEVVGRDNDAYLFLDLRQRGGDWEFCYEQWHTRTGSWDNFPTWQAGRDAAGFTSDVR